MVVRLDSNCEEMSVTSCLSIGQTFDLNLEGDIINWIRDAFHQEDCSQVVVITARNLQQLQAATHLVEEHLQRHAKFLCLIATQEDLDLVYWLEAYLTDRASRLNSQSLIYILRPWSASNVQYRDSTRVYPPTQITSN